MPSRDEVDYFGAGPAPLPTKVLEAGAQAFVNFRNTGLSLAEISHRSPIANHILADSKEALSKLLDIPDNYEILFMHGGGSGQFSAVVFNMVAYWIERSRRRQKDKLGTDGDETEIVRAVQSDIQENLACDYLVTGSWSLKASQEAANLLEPLKPRGSTSTSFVNIVADARNEKSGKFGTIPPENTWNPSTQPAFTYYCDNETVDGVEFPTYPPSLVPSDPASDLSRSKDPLVVADMSSNFLTRQVNVRNFAVIFGGAQKNIGITDTTIVIVRKDILENMPDPKFLHAVGVWSPPVIMNWTVIAKNNSLYNTLPIFSVWIAGQVMEDLLIRYGSDGIKGQERATNEKSTLLYGILEAFPAVYQVVPSLKAKSRVNICFRVKHGDAAAEKLFIAGAEDRMLQGLKGHRSVGGIRISNYNAVSLHAVKRLGDYLRTFASSS